MSIRNVQVLAAVMAFFGMTWMDLSIQQEYAALLVIGGGSAFIAFAALDVGSWVQEKRQNNAVIEEVEA